MTIQNQVSAIFEHPYFKQGVRNYVSGDKSDLSHLFSEAFIHCYLVVAQNCGREFRLNKWATHPVTYSAIKDIPPPVNLDLRLPIPLPFEEPVCKVVPLKIVKRYPKANHTPNQLEFLFPILNKASCILQEA